MSLNGLANILKGKHAYDVRMLIFLGSLVAKEEYRMKE